MPNWLLIDDVSLLAGKFGIKENAKEPVQFRTAKNVGLIAGGTGMQVITVPHLSLIYGCAKKSNIQEDVAW